MRLISALGEVDPASERRDLIATVDSRRSGLEGPGYKPTRLIFCA